jgi:hypothetical protein
MSFSKTLVKGTGKVHEYLESSAPGAPKERRSLSKGLRVSCATLRDLLIDPTFTAFLAHAESPKTLADGIGRLEEYSADAERMRVFLEAERELFQRAGLPVSVTNDLISKCEDIIVHRRFRERVQIGFILAELRTYICDRSDTFDSTRRRGVLEGTVAVLSGLTLASLNGGLLALTLGLSGAASAASIGLGTIVAAEGVGEVKKHL